ncbi:hypothetical protein AUEXF2481DRAFT_420805 [Aureobasidium subglaciale EXF-2481]|uniref:Uncharacterized protein n=1 Tax=Aureobasidium subglaciale (strain EXF-2481) TaxID=1043005 RepID=A0A074Y431_AURSE|nr:uncharacterized protein AUEXF2481DRAFT_420805 [Aureobasidium subglaciale EXF-2481]KEQ92480.1 hypothetical protein AUEXF2481DRAFT_420805 [Aureobasidium subglaciale EXF-2481]
MSRTLVLIISSPQANHDSYAKTCASRNTSLLYNKTRHGMIGLCYLNPRHRIYVLHRSSSTPVFLRSALVAFAIAAIPVSLFCPRIMHVLTLRGQNSFHCRLAAWREGMRVLQTRLKSPYVRDENAETTTHFCFPSQKPNTNRDRVSQQ